MAGHPGVLPTFLEWLMKEHPRRAPSQSEIARRTGISQSLAYKLLAGAHQAPDLITFQRLSEAYWVEWQEFLEAHPRVREELAEAFKFASGGVPTPSHGQDPQRRLAVSYLDQIFNSGDEEKRALVLQLLRTQADFARPSPSRAASGRRRARS